MTGLIVLFVVVMVLLAVLKLLPELLKASRGGVGTSQAGSLPDRKKEYLLSAAERSFYEVLVSVVGPEWRVFPKVRLADLLYVRKSRGNWQTHFNRVSAKHVDFVLCDGTKLGPRLVIELDDSSHDEPDRQDRDAFVDAALRAAGLPILHVPAQRAYVPGEIVRLIEGKLGG